MAENLDKLDEEFENAGASLDELIEKKFRDVNIETRVISFTVRRDSNIAFLLDEQCFTIEPYKTFYRIVHRSRMTFPKDILWNYVKAEVPEEQKDIYKQFIKRIYDEDLSQTSVKNIESVCKKLLELSGSRNLLVQVGEIVNNLKTFKLKEAKKKLQKVIFSESNLDKNYGGDYLKDFEERVAVIKQKIEHPETFLGIPTGIKEFDDLSGGLQRGEFGVVIAGTGVGKSVALGNFGLNAWLKGYNVLMISLEMTKHQVEFRLDSRLTKISHTKFRKGELDKKDLQLWFDRIRGFRKERDNFYEIRCMHRGCCTLEIEEEAMKIQSQWNKKVDLIVIDYINLMMANEFKGEKREWKGQAEIAWDIKALCMDFNETGVPIWTANQITDEGAKAKKLETYHLKYARAISETAPVIVALSQSVDDSLQDIMKMWILKCRDFANIKRPIILHPKFNIMALNQEFKMSKLDDLRGPK